MNAILTQVTRLSNNGLFRFLVGFVAGLLLVFLLREPKVVKEVIPQIITKYDTVIKTPDWLQDSIKRWKKIKYSTDTHTVVLTQTIVDTQYVPVDAPAIQRPNIWPLLSYHGAGAFGDTAVIRTYSAQSGREAVSKVFISGYLTDVEVEDAHNPTPKLNYKPFPPAERHNWLYPVKKVILGVGIGFGACTILEKVP